MLRQEEGAPDGGWLPYRLAWLLADVQDELSMYTKAAWQTFWSPLSTSNLPEAQVQPLQSPKTPTFIT